MTISSRCGWSWRRKYQIACLANARRSRVGITQLTRVTAVPTSLPAASPSALLAYRRREQRRGERDGVRLGPCLGGIDLHARLVHRARDDADLGMLDRDP